MPYGVSWQYDLQRFVGRRSIDVAFDVGANVGQTADAILRYFPGASVHCFEPISATYQQLVRAVGGRAHVRCRQDALGSAVGSAVVSLHRNSELNTLVPHGPRADDLTGEHEAVRVNTLDAYCAAEAVDHIDVLKMDVQGWEVEVLRGAQEMLAHNRVRSVLSEVGFRRGDRDMQHFAELNDLMETSRFWLAGFYEPFRWGKNKSRVGFANVLYLHESA